MCHYPSKTALFLQEQVITKRKKMKHEMSDGYKSTDVDGYNFIYNDGDYQITEETVVTKISYQGEEPEERKYYSVDKGYKHIASFKEKKEALLWVGWKNKLEANKRTEEI